MVCFLISSIVHQRSITDPKSVENPYSAAQRFLQNNDLPLTYLDEVVRFIEKNTAGVKIGGAGEFQDPFTGTSMLTQSCITQSYPVSGASRYQPAQSQAANSNTEYMDPFTGV